MKANTLKADTTGIIASTLCMIHCIATPFIFLAQSCTISCCSDAPSWWKWIDVAFLLISLFAIAHTSKQTTKIWVKSALWISWSLLLIIILNEQLQLLSLFKNAIFIPALMLVALHLYNLKYCKCAEKTCCTNQA